MSPDYQVPGRVPNDGVARQAVSDYWRERFSAEPYYDQNQFYDDYEPAYQIGHQARADDYIRAYEQVEAELESRWRDERGSSKLEWAQARAAVRRGWEQAATVDPYINRDRNGPHGT